MTHTYEYPMISAAATIALVYAERARLLLVKRSLMASAFPDYWSLPGGFVNAGTETAEQAAVREMREETGLEIRENQLNLFYVSSRPETDPRGHVVNVCYWAIYQPEQGNPLAGDDVSEAMWFSYRHPVHQPLAFDHADIVKVLRSIFP